jgi:cardiolipin synthase
LILRHLPNALTLLRIILIAPLAWLLAHGRYTPALGMLVFAAVSDAADGFIAKRFGWASELGKVLDPLADKLLLVTLFITLSIADVVPVWLAAIVVLRDVTIASGAIAYRWLIGPVHGRPLLLSKFNTAFQLLYLVTTVMAAIAGSQVPYALIVILSYCVLITTLTSGVEYVLIYSKRAVAMSRARHTSSVR